MLLILAIPSQASGISANDLASRASLICAAFRTAIMADEQLALIRAAEEREGREQRESFGGWFGG
jgi:hypothetical protein